VGITHKVSTEFLGINDQSSDDGTVIEKGKAGDMQSSY